MILEERSFYPSYSSDPGPTFLGLIYPGPTFLGQFNISDLTNTQRAQVTIDMGLVEREICWNPQGWVRTKSTLTESSTDTAC